MGAHHKTANLEKPVGLLYTRVDASGLYTQ